MRTDLIPLLSVKGPREFGSNTSGHMINAFASFHSTVVPCGAGACARVYRSLSVTPTPLPLQPALTDSFHPFLSTPTSLQAGCFNGTEELPSTSLCCEAFDGDTECPVTPVKIDLAQCPATPTTPPAPTPSPNSPKGSSPAAAAASAATSALLLVLAAAVMLL